MGSRYYKVPVIVRGKIIEDLQFVALKTQGRRKRAECGTRVTKVRRFELVLLDKVRMIV